LALALELDEELAEAEPPRPPLALALELEEELALAEPPPRPPPTLALAEELEEELALAEPPPPLTLALALELEDALAEAEPLPRPRSNASAIAWADEAASAAALNPESSARLWEKSTKKMIVKEKRIAFMVRNESWVFLF
jgi:hypothetical protein